MNKKGILSIYIIISLAIAAGLTFFCYKNRTEEWGTQSRAALRQALVREIQRRDNSDVYYAGIESDCFSEDSFCIKKEPVTVHLKNENGEKDFLVPYGRRSRNIDRTAANRVICTYLLEKHPLKADSLDRVWKELLAGMKVPGETRVRIGVSGWEEDTTYSHSGGLSEVAGPSDSVFCYLGCRSEVEVTGYVYYAWWPAFLEWNVAGQIAWAICAFGIFFFRRHLAGTRRATAHEAVSPHAASASQVLPVIVVKEEAPLVFRLDDDFVFDARSKTLCRGSDTAKLSPLLTNLLVGFLNKEDRRLTVEEIKELLWPNGTGTIEKVHTTIKRLRTVLSAHSDWQIENEYSVYLLRKNHRQ